MNESFSSKILAFLSNEKVDTAIDYGAGGGLISASIYADLTNILHVLTMLGGFILIVQRIIRNYKRGK